MVVVEVAGVEPGGELDDHRPPMPPYPTPAPAVPRKLEPIPDDCITKATPSAPCPTVVSMFTVKKARRLPLVEKGPRGDRLWRISSDGAFLEYCRLIDEPEEPIRVTAPIKRPPRTIEYAVERPRGAVSDAP